jgi:pyruvate ferredoxin oxidoreductase gamma subunit
LSEVQTLECRYKEIYGKRTNVRKTTGESMLQIRFHGRGGQGVVTAAEMLSVAAFLEGKHAAAFPSFGSERMGAPVMSFCRIDNKEIRLREPVLDPDVLIIQDPTLFRVVNVFDGLKPTGYLLVNSHKSAAELGLADAVAKLPKGHCRMVPASEIAMQHVGRPLPNAALLGAFAALTEEVKLASVEAAIRDAFAGKIGEANVAAAKACYDAVAGVTAAA